MFILLASPNWLQDKRHCFLVEELKKRGRSDILVCIGGVIPPQDYQYLYDHGATAIFGPGTNIPKCCIELLQILVDRAKAEAREG